MKTSALETPMMRQYLGIKADHPDAIVFYRMGDFYEMFLDDAERAAPLLDIVLTTRDKGKDDPVPMCGVPVHSAEQYIKRLADLGHRVAICEQMEDPRRLTGRRLVKRAVVEVVTPGLVGDPVGIEGSEEVSLVALCPAENGQAGALAALDASTGEFRGTSSRAEGDPALLATDIGPVIDEQARAVLEEHGKRMARLGTEIKRLALPDETAEGSFVAPMAFEIDRIDQLEREVFGPILHVIRYRADRLDGVIEAINATGYGLTLGIHSRVDLTVRYIQRRLRVGNIYVNRNMIGAVVGVQPFGGEGLSGTGPKAGGPRYLQRFATERTMSVNTAAAGGNAALMSLGEEELS